MELGMVGQQLEAARREREAAETELRDYRNRAQVGRGATEGGGVARDGVGRRRGNNRRWTLMAARQSAS